MTSTGLKGIGMFTVGTNNPLGAKYPLFEATSSWSLTSAAEIQTETGWAAMSSTCVQQTLNSIASSKALTLTLTFADISWELIQHMFGEFAQTTTAYDEFVGEASRVPLTAPYVYTHPDLAGGTVDDIAVGALSRNNTWGERGPRAVVAAAPADTSEVQIDGTANTLTFDAASAGMPFAWCGTQSRANIDTIGVEANPQSFLEIGYTGIICMDGAKAVNGVRITIPRMKFNESFDFEQADTAPAPELTYDLLLAEGKRSTIEFARRLAA